MKPIRTHQRYKCDFCSKRGVKWTIEKHEKRCWGNPNRYCEVCDNTGEASVAWYDNGCHREYKIVECPDCSQRRCLYAESEQCDPKMWFTPCEQCERYIKACEEFDKWQKDTKKRPF